MLPQTNPTPPTPEVVGGIQFNFSTPGARSLALGGAFVGLADDATAAFSNPAGLTQLTEMEASLEARKTDFTHEFNESGRAFGDPTGMGIDTISGVQTAASSSQVPSVSFLSFVYPTTRWAIAGYRHEMANFETEIRTTGVFYSRITDNLDTRLFPVTGELDLEIVAYGVSGAFDIADSFSIGLGVAFYDFEIDSLTQRFFVSYQDYDPPDYSASNVALLDQQFGKDQEVAINAGFLWRIGEVWRVGGVYRQGPDFDFTTASTNPTTGASIERSARFSVPDVFGLGVAFRPIDAFTISFDYDRVEYSSLNTIDALRPGCSSSLSVDDGDEFHLGLEYIFLKPRYPIAVRLGGWYDPEHNIAFRSRVNTVCDQEEFIRFPTGDNTVHYTAGVGLKFGRFQLDAAVDLSELVDTVSISGVVKF